MSVQPLRKETGPVPGARPHSAGDPPPGAAGGPPPGVSGGPPPGAFTGAESGLEGREEELGKSIAVVLKTLRNTQPYAHEINDALIKSHLQAMQFAKDHGMMDEFVAHDIKTVAPLTVAPLNERMRGLIEKTGQREIVLIGIFDRTACHYQLCLDNESSPGMRRWRSPFGRVLAASHKLGQFDLDRGVDPRELDPSPPARLCRIHGSGDAGVALAVRRLAHRRTRLSWERGHPALGAKRPESWAYH